MEDADSGVGRVGVHQRNGTVERHRRRGQVFENICIVQTERVTVEWIVASSGGEGKRSGVLGDTVDVAVIWELDIDRKRLGT